MGLQRLPKVARLTPLGPAAPCRDGNPAPQGFLSVPALLPQGPARAGARCPPRRGAGTRRPGGWLLPGRLRGRENMMSARV